MAAKVNETAVITLKKPVTILVGNKEETHSVLRVREPQVGDLLILDDYAESRMAGMVALVASLCEVPELVIKRLGLPDFEAVSGVVDGFLPDGQPTGKTRPGTSSARQSSRRK